MARLILVLPVPVTHVRNESGNNNSANTVDRFWQVDASGSFLASLTFSYAASENAAGGNTAMRAQRWNATIDGWDPALPSQSNPTPQSVLVNNVTTSGPWTIATSSSPLPVELLYYYYLTGIL